VLFRLIKRHKHNLFCLKQVDFW